MTNCYI